MKLYFLKVKRSSAGVQVAVSGQKNKGMGTKSDKEVFWKVDPQKRVLHILQVFLRCWTAFDNGF